jgi:hypothetical protein
MQRCKSVLIYISHIIYFLFIIKNNYSFLIISKNIILFFEIIDRFKFDKCQLILFLNKSSIDECLIAKYDNRCLTLERLKLL